MILCAITLNSYNMFTRLRIYYNINKITDRTYLIAYIKTIPF